jgi:hypothetical protein
VKLTLLIGAINVWNRIAIGFRSVHPGEAELLATREADAGWRRKNRPDGAFPGGGNGAERR